MPRDPNKTSRWERAATTRPVDLTGHIRAGVARRAGQCRGGGWRPSLFAAAWILMPTLAAADSVTVQSGVESEIANHVRYGSNCQANRVEIRILTEPANGTVTVKPKSIVVTAQSGRGVPQPSHCFGKTMQGVAVYYQSKPGFVGQDSVRYQRLNPRDAGDRFNAEVDYTIMVVASGAQQKAEIEKLNAQFAERFNKGDAAGVAAMYTDDAVVLPPGAGIAKGRAEIEAFWKKAAEAFGGMKLTTLDAKMLGQNAARETGYFTLQTKSQPPQEVTGKYIVIWERSGSDWRLGTDIWNEGR